MHRGVSAYLAERDPPWPEEGGDWRGLAVICTKSVEIQGGFCIEFCIE